MNLNTIGIHTNTHKILHLTATGSLKLTDCWFPRMWLELIDMPRHSRQAMEFSPYSIQCNWISEIACQRIPQFNRKFKNWNRIANKLEINCQRIPQFNWNIKVKNHIANKFRRKIGTFINCHPNLATVPETFFTAIPEDSMSSGIPHCQITHLTVEN